MKNLDVDIGHTMEEETVIGGESQDIENTKKLEKYLQQFKHYRGRIFR